MPNMDGYRLTQRIRQLGADARCGRDGKCSLEEQRCLESGMDSHLSKWLRWIVPKQDDAVNSMPIPRKKNADMRAQAFVYSCGRGR